MAGAVRTALTTYTLPPRLDGIGELKALDLYCGGGGSCLGLQAAGFEVVGIDIEVHPNYPGTFIQGDVTALPVDIMDFHLIWASPPCQRFSVATHHVEDREKVYEDLIPFTRELIKGHPFTCIENVPNAPIRADVVLTGASVGLPYILRKRHFELSFFMMYPTPATGYTYFSEDKREGIGISVTKKMEGMSPESRQRRRELGFKCRADKDRVKAVMGIPRSQEMTYAELGEAVPPRYAEIIARQAIQQMRD